MKNSTKREYIKGSNNLIYIAIVVSAALWLFDSMIDTFVFMRGGFWENLTGSSIMEIWMRLTIMFMIIGFALYSRRKIMEREMLISELQDAIAQIKTLKGLIPICSYCKNIRDDSGIWNKIEAYFAKHVDADFTHGMCPDCADDFREQVRRDD